MLSHSHCSYPQVSPCADFTSTPRSAGGSLLSCPITFHSSLPMRTLCHTDHVHPRMSHYPYATIDHHVHSIHSDQVNLNTVSLLKVFRQYTLTMIVTKVSDQQKMIARESWTDEKTGVPERSRVPHHPCQKDFALNPLCPGYH